MAGEGAVAVGVVGDVGAEQGGGWKERAERGEGNSIRQRQEAGAVVAVRVRW